MSKTTTNATPEAAPTMSLFDRFRAIVTSGKPSTADLADVERALRDELAAIERDIDTLTQALVLTDDAETRAKLADRRTDADVSQRRIAALVQPVEAARRRETLETFERHCAAAAKADELRKDARRKLEAAQQAAKAATNDYNAAAMAHTTAMAAVDSDFAQGLPPADRQALAHDMARIKHTYKLMPEEDFAYLMAHNQENQ